MSLYEQIKELSEAATKGPWFTGIRRILSDGYESDSASYLSAPTHEDMGFLWAAMRGEANDPTMVANAELIVTLVNNTDVILAALKAQEWLPIDEQCPQAWVRVLLYCPREAEPVLVGHWNPDFKAWVLDTSGEVVDSTGACTFELHPTHFKPIGSESPVCQRCDGSGKLTIEGMPVKKCPDCHSLPTPPGGTP